MIQNSVQIVRKSRDRGHVQIDWLNSYHTFSFRSVWLHVAQGEITIDDLILTAGDAIAYPGGSEFELSSSSNGEILLFDLA